VIGRNLFFGLVAAYLFVLFGDLPNAQAEKWKSVDQADAVIKFKNWPETDDCRFVKRMTDDYAKEITSVRCPRFPSRRTISTYVRISDLSPGYYWTGAKGADIRESPIFDKTSGWFYNFHGAKFDPGQKFVCFQDSECAWRRITFKVDETPCQYVQIIPGVGGTNDFYGHRDSPLALTLVHCGTDKPIGRKNIVYADEKIMLIYPDESVSRAAPGSSTTEPAGLAEIQAKITAEERARTRSEQRCLHGEASHCDLADRQRAQLEGLRKKLKELSRPGN
jgi:hypothetical protein